MDFDQRRRLIERSRLCRRTFDDLRIVERVKARWRATVVSRREDFAKRTAKIRY
jgi:hypothetical protein